MAHVLHLDQIHDLAEMPSQTKDRQQRPSVYRLQEKYGHQQHDIHLDIYPYQGSRQLFAIT